MGPRLREGDVGEGWVLREQRFLNDLKNSLRIR